MKKYVKKIFVSLLFYVFMLIPFNVFAESLSIDFEKNITNDNNVIIKGQKLSNGNYVFVGNTFDQIPGDDFYGREDSTVYILDSNMNILKTRTIGTQGYDYAQNVIIFDDEKFLVQSFYSSNNGITVFSLYDNNGNLLKEVEYENCRNVSFKKIDDKIYITYNNYLSPGYRYYFGILDSDLNINIINDNTPEDLTMVNKNRFINYYNSLVYDDDFNIIFDYSNIEEDEAFTSKKLYMSSNNILYVFGYRKKAAIFEYEGQTIDYYTYDFVVKRYDENFEFLDEHVIIEKQYYDGYSDKSNYIYEIYENENGSLNIVFQEFYINYELDGENLSYENYLQTHLIKLDETGYKLYDYKYLTTNDKNYLFQDIIKEDDYTYSFVIYTYLKLFGEGTYNKANSGIATIKENSFSSNIISDEFVNVDFNNRDYLIGDKIVFNYTTDLGYKLKSIKVYDKDINEDITDEVNLYVDNKILYMPGRNIMVKFESEKIDYKFIEGMDSTYETDALTFVLDGEASLFKDLYIDGKLVDKGNYKIKSGSTIITISSDYLETLDIGNHKIKVIYTNGSTPETNFSVVKKTISEDNKNEEIENPKTSDDINEEIENPKTFDNINIFVMINIVSILTIIGLFVYKKNNLLKNK